MSLTQQETLFVSTLSDIEKRLSDTDPYEILLISGLIRKLFLDEVPLVDQVNRNHHIKLSFEVAVPVSPPDSYTTFWSIQDGLYPDTAPPFKKRILLTRDKFFQTVVTVINKNEYTVQDIILFEANVMGGIHAGSPKSEKEKILYLIDSTFSIGGFGSSTRGFFSIARVILKTLASLRQKILSN